MPAQQGPDDAALDHQDGERGDQVGAQHHAPVGVVMRQQDGKVKGVRASGEARLQENPLQGILCIWRYALSIVKVQVSAPYGLRSNGKAQTAASMAEEKMLSMMHAWRLQCRRLHRRACRVQGEMGIAWRPHHEAD